MYSNFSDERHGTPRIRNVMVAGVESDLLPILCKVRTRRETRIDGSMPARAVVERRQVHPVRGKVGVVNKEESLARKLAALVARVELDTERARFRIVPVRCVAVTVRAEPCKVRNLVVVQILAERELAPLKNWITAHEGDRLAEELAEFVVLRCKAPGNPADLVVLTVGVVIAELRPRELIATEQHRRARREEERAHMVLHQLAAER